jgi:hypothetical protein
MRKSERNKIARRTGENAAGWIEQDSWGGRVASQRSSDEAAAAFLGGWRDGAPATLDALPSFSLDELASDTELDPERDAEEVERLADLAHNAMCAALQLSGRAKG